MACQYTPLGVVPHSRSPGQQENFNSSGHDHDEGHSSDGATSTTPAVLTSVLVAALAALAYA
jgi:hypothetical protein